MSALEIPRELREKIPAGACVMWIIPDRGWYGPSEVIVTDADDQPIGYQCRVDFPADHEVMYQWMRDEAQMLGMRLRSRWLSACGSGWLGVLEKD